MSRQSKLRGLTWMGGKSLNSVHGPGRWIASQLPTPTDNQVYVEPFAGMLSILLSRVPAGTEIICDTDERLINWWQVVRDQPKELAQKMQYTPHSRTQYERCKELQKDMESDPLERAWALSVVCSQSIRSTAEGGSWRIVRAGKNPTKGGAWERIEALADRLRYVQLENRDAIRVMEWVADSEHAVLYCDPPYGDARPYATDVDRQLLSDVLLAQKGRVAISGYPGDWDHLEGHGWHRQEFSSYVNLVSHSESTEKTEALWTNYKPLVQEALF